ncbi:MAG: iron ABC transporter permease [Thermoplasmata archaeon]|jgi:iron complex transport system permease protein|nr:iron ABC transporter permease [Thermoplasmata archaeon]
MDDSKEIPHRHVKQVYDASSSKKRTFVAVTAILTFVAAVTSVSLGAVDIPIVDTLKVFGHKILPGIIAGPSQTWYSDIILKDRMSRTLLCVVCGFCLAVAGAVMQNVLRNPLVSPFTLGLSSAASFGAAIAIMFGGGITGSVMVLGHEFFTKNLLVATLAFAVSLASVGFVILLTRNRNVSRSTVILTGVIISYLFQAGVSATKYFSSDDALREITLWLMGGMWNASWGVDFLVLPVVIACTVVLELYSVKINILSAGDEVASSLGIDVQKLRSITLVICTLMTSVCIAFTGIIGFIGLMAPHITRMFIGNDSRYLFPAAGLFGGFILLVSDIVARMVIRPEQIPVGIIMYIIGGIFFIWLVTNRKKGVTM